MMQSAESNLDEADYRAMVKTVREDLLRFDLSKQHLKVILWILDLSYGWGLAAVRIPKLGILKELTGLSVPHLSNTIKELSQMRILVVSKSDDGAVEYKVQPNCDLWHCRPLSTRDEIRRAMDWLKSSNLGSNGVKLMRPLEMIPLEMAYPPTCRTEITED